MRIINWNEKNKAILTSMWNDKCSDKEISEFFDAKAYAIAKQRSNMGLVHVKMPKNIKRKSRSVTEVIKGDRVLRYDRDGKHHYSTISSKMNEATFQNILRKMLNKNKDIRSITVLKPVKVISRTKFINIE